MGFLQVIDVLNQEEKAVTKFITNVSEIWKWPIRVILRDTSSYRLALLGEQKQWHPTVLPSEQQQLNRQDIPYFFRTMGSNKLRYFSSALVDLESSASEVELESYLFPRLEIMRIHENLGCDFGWKNRRSLREAGLMQLARCFLPADLKQGSEAIGELRISVTPEEICCQLRNGQERTFLCKR
ncbi:hypothetical protein WDW37_03790 [Bdellovibrionota bacterium FG-1]